MELKDKILKEALEAIDRLPNDWFGTETALPLKDIPNTNKKASSQLKAAMKEYKENIKESPLKYEEIFFSNINDLLVD